MSLTYNKKVPGYRFSITWHLSRYIIFPFSFPVLSIILQLAAHLKVVITNCYMYHISVPILFWALNVENNRFIVEICWICVVKVRGPSGHMELSGPVLAAGTAVLVSVSGYKHF